MKKILWVFIFLFSLIWISYADEIKTTDQLYNESMILWFYNQYYAESDISHVSIIIQWDYQHIPYMLETTFADYCTKFYSRKYKDIYNHTIFTCSVVWNDPIITNEISMMESITFRLLTWWETSSWSSLQSRMDDLIIWWRDWVDKLLNWSIWTIISFLIWFLILSMVVYKLNQVFWWFWWKRK